MSNLKVMILCGRSPRHLYIANKLCLASQPVAIVQEVGSHWSLKKIINLLKPNNLYKKIWRWLRDRKRYLGGKEAQFFFGDKEPSLSRPELVNEVPHINHPDVLKLTEQYQPEPYSSDTADHLQGL